VFILQAVVYASENQDMAVGDENIYGKETIVEPSGIGDQAMNDIPLNRYGSVNGPAANLGIPTLHTTAAQKTVTTARGRQS
jgi:hypothetical protein